MKKIFLATLLTGGALMGADNVGFIGVSVGNAELKSTIGPTSHEAKIDDTHYTATLGQYIGDNGRIALSYSYVEPKNNIKNSDAASLAYDFVVPVMDNMFMVYAGPVIGYTRYKEEVAGIKLDLSGLHYGAEAGVIVRLVNFVELEAGYRYLVETGSDTVVGINVDPDTLRMWYMGANLRF